MNNFWTNIVRYPRFFISSLIGLIFVILNPFRNFIKIPKWRIILVLNLLIVIILLYFILINMIGL